MLIFLTDIVLFLVAFVMLLIGTIEDFKKKEVYDLLSYLPITIAIISRLFYSFITKDFHYIIYPLVSVLFALTFGLIMYYFNQWGGGDVNFLIASAFLLGTWPVFLLNHRAIVLIQFMKNPYLVAFSFFMLYFLISLIMGIFVGIGYGIYMLIRYPRKFSNAFKSTFKTHKYFIIITFFAFLFVLFEYFFSGVIEILYIALFVLIFLIITIFTLSIEKMLVFTIPPTRLTEGDWIIEDIYVDGKKIYSKNQPGVSLSQIEELIKLYKRGKIKEVRIREGFPFIPSFLLSLIIMFILFF